MKKIKIAALVCCLTMLTGLFAACGNDSSLSQPVSSDVSSSLAATPAPTEEPKEETKTAFFLSLIHIWGASRIWGRTAAR